MKFMVAKGHIKIVLPHLNYIYDMLHFWCQHNRGDWSKPTLITLAKLFKYIYFSRKNFKSFQEFSSKLEVLNQ
jgi:hypothetical protein